MKKSPFEKSCKYDYKNKCDCSEDDNCGCDFPNNMDRDFDSSCFEDEDITLENIVISCNKGLYFDNQSSKKSGKDGEYWFLWLIL